jgi:hypothetical protein
LELTHPIAIEVVPRLTQEGGENAVGCYQEEEKEIYIVTFATFEKRGNWFGVPTTRSMYGSVVAHEVAHAIASCHFAVPEPSLHAHEFIAFTTMLATMDPVSRAEILSLHPGVVFEDESEINEVTFFIRSDVLRDCSLPVLPTRATRRRIAIASTLWRRTDQ